MPTTVLGGITVGRKLSLKTLTLITATLPALWATGARAEKVEEVIVTAQKREQSIQKVGVAITALGKETLHAIGRQDVTALANYVPGLEVNQYSPTVTVFNIRGVSQNDFTDAQEAPIAFYEDEVYYASTGSISGTNFDLARVEILRGPQGTLFGRNATGGLVQFITAKPTDTTQGFLTLTGGSYGQIATEGAAGGKIADDVDGRFAFTTNNSDGYITNRVGRSVGSNDSFALRGETTINFSPDDRLFLKAQVLRNDHETDAGLYSWAAAYPNAQGLGVFVGPNQNIFGTCPGCDPFGYKNPASSPFNQAYNINPYFDRTFWEIEARYQHDFGWASFVSITDYQHLHKSYGEDSTADPLPVFDYYTHQSLYQISEEARLTGDIDRLHWIAGLYGLNIHTVNSYLIDALPILGFTDRYGGPQDTKSAAAFGQAEYALTPQVSLIGGLRLSYDHKHEDYTDATNGVTDFDFATTYPALAKDRFEDFRNYSGKFEVDYKPVSDLLLYASINRGTKAGGFSVLSGGPFSPQAVAAIPFGQEVLTNAEGGFKWTLLDRRAHLDMSVFHYGYDGYQAFTNIGLSQEVHNYTAHEQGLEVAGDLQPVDGLFLSGFLTLLDTTIEGLHTPNGTILDRRMPQAPKTSIGWAGHYDYPVGPGTLSLATDWKYDSVQFLEAYNSPVDREPGRIIGNVRISYDFGGPAGNRWEGAFFINNVTDKYYRLYNLDLSGLLGDVNQVYAKPRTFGGSLTYRF
jgi:iron complex outermembrane receptor protein